MEGALLWCSPSAGTRENIMRFWLTGVILTLLLTDTSTGAAESTSLVTKVSLSIELRDQFDVLQRLSFPATNVTVLAIADRKGSEEVDGWVAALKPLYAGAVDFRGVAYLAGVPEFLHAKVRARFQETRQYPVMLDWSGKVCEQLCYERGTANILIIDRDGIIRARIRGSASQATIALARQALEAALSSTTSTARLPRPPHANESQ